MVRKGEPFSAAQQWQGSRDDYSIAQLQNTQPEVTEEACEVVQPIAENQEPASSGKDERLAKQSQERRLPELETEKVQAAQKAPGMQREEERPALSPWFVLHHL